MAEQRIKQVSISETGEMRDNLSGEYVLCPLLLASNGRRLYCSTRCAWFSQIITETRQLIARCQNTEIGEVTPE